VLSKNQTLGEVCKKFGIPMEFWKRTTKDWVLIPREKGKLRKNTTLRSIDGVRPPSVNIPIAQGLAGFSTEVANGASELETKAEEGRAL
jgi:hypothetical protein